MTHFVLLSTMNLSRMRAISHCQSPCIADQWNANYPSYVSIRLIQNSKNDTFGLVSSFFFHISYCFPISSATLFTSLRNIQFGLVLSFLINYFNIWWQKNWVYIFNVFVLKDLGKTFLEEPRYTLNNG